MKRKIRILFLAPSMRPGGAERFLTVLIRYINREQFIPSLGLVRKSGPLLGELPDDVDVYDLNCQRVRNAWVKIVRLIRKTKPDIVFSTLAHLNFAVAMARPLLLAKIKYVARENSIPSQNIKQSPIKAVLPFLYKLLYPKFDKVICQSQYMFDELTTHFKISVDTLAVINNPVDVEKIQTLGFNQKYCLPEGKVNIIAAGRLKYLKGFDLLLQSAAYIEGIEFHLTILGEGEEEERLKKLARQLNIDDRVTFSGYVPNPYSYMCQADLFVLSSRSDAFPNVVLEALACGLPVVAFDCPGGIKEIIVDGENGWIVEAENFVALARAIERAVAMGIGPSQLEPIIERKFGVKKILSEYERLFSKIVQQDIA